MEVEAIVIGAGNGGLGAALSLALEGVKVLLIEQHNIPGGFATSFVRGRFEFEVSLHQMAEIGPTSARGTCREFLDNKAGLDIDWVRVPEAYRVIVPPENIDETLPFGVEEFISVIAKHTPHDRPALEEFFKQAKDIFDVLMFLNDLTEKPGDNILFSELKNYIRSNKNLAKTSKEILKKVSEFLRTAPYTAKEITDQYDFSDTTKALLYPYWCYMGVPSDRMSHVIWSTMLQSYMERGGYIPRQRSQELSYAMAEKIRECGGLIQYNTRVNKILVENGRATGVELEDGERIRASHIISNASPNLVYNDMISPSSAVPKQAFQNINARVDGTSAFVVYLGLDASPEELGLTEYGYFIQQTSSTEEIYNSFSTLDVTKGQAAICLNNAIPDCSPEGTTILSLTTLYNPKAWESVKPPEYFKLKNDIARKMIDQVEEALDVKIKNHIEEVDVAAPPSFSRYTSAYKGIIYGYEVEPWDSMIPRIVGSPLYWNRVLPKRVKPIDENFIEALHFAGGFSFLCHGFNGSLMSGRMAALGVLDQMGRLS